MLKSENCSDFKLSFYSIDFTLIRHERTERERDALRLVVTGALNKQIAADLGITKRTVKQHRGRGTRSSG